MRFHYSQNPIGLRAALGQLERRQTAERTRLALAHKTANGERYTRVAPYGYRWRDGRLARVPKERRTVVLMQRLRANGWSYVCIAWNSIGAASRRTTLRNGQQIEWPPWPRDSVLRLL